MAHRLFTGTTIASFYAKYRPSYPKKLVEAIVAYLKKESSPPFSLAIDIGCGSGQSSHILACHFEHVIGTDVSEAQIEEAKKSNTLSNVSFKVGSAESIPAETSSVDLVTTAQAMHWFDLKVFYEEVDRVLKPGGVLAGYMYALPELHHKSCSEKLNNVLVDFYQYTVNHGCWHEGRKHIEAKYKDIHLPYEDSLRDESMQIERQMSLDDFIGYLSSWSGYNAYIKKFPEDSEILSRYQEKFFEVLKSSTPDDNDSTITVTYDIVLLMGRKPEVHK